MLLRAVLLLWTFRNGQAAPSLSRRTRPLRPARARVGVSGAVSSGPASGLGVRGGFLEMEAGLCVAAGAACGALCRHTANKAAQAYGAQPWQTLGVNILGSAIMGATYASSLKHLSPGAKLAVGTGFCGSLTTFSSFAVDAVAMLEAGAYSKALLYVTANNAACFSSAFLGIKFARKFLK
ncbi:CrcB-like protein-domain-containing protein [Pelagophyceae sp. CCMP2097]|nr:CrcB-like protein-domain-containing protein [Pelagophyceae sp. CCMP2097]|mmetsp:Transcript_32234/g.113477  ORF Transcript_32234/g.113477 Transcript_32234/m.113477 type:complete len:180 (-) Transcript_32234:73-612(-)